MIRYVASKIKKVFSNEELQVCINCGKKFPEGIIVCPWCSNKCDDIKCKPSKEE